MGPESGNHKQGEGFQGPKIRPRYNWQRLKTSFVLLWEGNIVATVEEGGQFWVTWRGINHRGAVRSSRLARRFIERWLAARPPLPPLLSSELPPKTLTSLEAFLKQEEDLFGR